MKVIMTKNKQYVKIDAHDTWSMDCTLAHIIVPMLKQLKATTHGGPFVDMDERPEYLIGTFPNRESGATDEFHFQAWDWVLDEMIWAFESKLEDWEDQFCSGRHDVIWEPLENGMSEMKHGPHHTFKIDWEARSKYQERITNGFRLFGKYYENLWD